MFLLEKSSWATDNQIDEKGEDFVVYLKANTNVNLKQILGIVGSVELLELEFPSY